MLCDGEIIARVPRVVSAKRLESERKKFGGVGWIPANHGGSTHRSVYLHLIDYRVYHRSNSYYFMPIG